MTKENRWLQKDNAVTEILGTMLLLVISLIIFSTVYFSVLSIPQKEAAPNANIAFSFDNDTVTLSHLSGSPVDPESTISIIIDGNRDTIRINEFNSWDNNSNNLWNFGEKLVYNTGESNLLAKNITVSILDKNSNSLVLHGNYHQPPEYEPKMSTFVNDISFYQVGPTVSITAAGDFMLTNVSLYYRYSSDGISWSDYTFFSNDSNHPWKWTFDFPQNFGWYEFYSIGYYNSQSENPPSTADTSCQYTLAPVISNPYPAQGETNVELTPELAVTITDGDNGDENVMDLTWFSNVSGSWQQIKLTSNIGNGTYTCDTLGLMTDKETTYYWNVSVTDGTNTVESDIYHFTTISDNDLPNAPINPNPVDGASDIGLNPILSVDVSDPDGDNMDVTFYRDSDGSIIGTDHNVANGSTASITWTGLNLGNTYSWYAVADDTIGGATQSVTWSFTTIPNADTVSLRPIGDGDLKQLSDSEWFMTNWECVDDVNPDGDSTYVENPSQDTWKTDTYDTQNSGNLGSIINVTVNVRCRKEGADSSNSYAKTVIRIDENNYLGNPNNLDSSYTTYSTTYATNPNGNPWSWSDINSLECGVSLYSGKIPPWWWMDQSVARCTQVWIEVNYTT